MDYRSIQSQRSHSTRQAGHKGVRSSRRGKSPSRHKLDAKTSSSSIGKSTSRKHRNVSGSKSGQDAMKADPSDDHTSHQSSPRSSAVQPLFRTPLTVTPTFPVSYSLPYTTTLGLPPDSQTSDPLSALSLAPSIVPSAVPLSILPISTPEDMSPRTTPLLGPSVSSIVPTSTTQASLLTLPQAQASTTHKSLASHQSPPIALIASLAGAGILVFLFAPCLVRRLIRRHRDRALVSPANFFSPRMPAKESFDSPLWGNSNLEKKSFSSPSEDAKGWASMFPEPPRHHLVKQKLHPDAKLQISKPHPVVLPDFVGVPYADDYNGQDPMLNDRMYERGDPFEDPGRSKELSADQQFNSIYPRVNVTVPTPSNSASSGMTIAASEQRGPGYNDTSDNHRTSRSFSYVTFDGDASSKINFPATPPAVKKSNLKRPATTKKAVPPTAPSTASLQVNGGKQKKRPRTEEERRARDTKALTSALGLSSPPSPSLYSPSLRSASPMEPPVPVPNGRVAMEREATVTPHLAVRSPTVESLSPMGRWMMTDYADDERDLSSPSLPYISQNQEYMQGSLTDAHGMVFDMVDTETRLRRRLSQMDDDARYSSGIGIATIPDPPPRLPSPPLIPSLAQLALATNQPDYRSPTYSLYGIYKPEEEKYTPGGASGGKQGMA